MQVDVSNKAVPQCPEAPIALSVPDESVPQPPSVSSASLPTTRNQTQSSVVSGDVDHVWVERETGSESPG